MIKKVWPIKLKKSDEEVTSRSGLILFDEFIKHIKEVARQGYALDNEEYNPGVKCVAVPIRYYTGRVVGGISVPAPSYRMTDAVLKGEIIPIVKVAGEKASKGLGFGA